MFVRGSARVLSCVLGRFSRLLAKVELLEEVGIR